MAGIHSFDSVPGSTVCKLVCVDLFSGFDVGFMYFDDDKTLYLGPEAYERTKHIIESGIPGDLNYVVLSYTKEQSPIEHIAQEIICKYVEYVE